MPVHRAWDAALARRAAAVGLVTAAASLFIVAATDDGAPWPRRLAMWAALLPIAGAIGAAAAVRLAASRGELRALEALGVEPARVVLGAGAGGMAIAALGPALAASRWSDLAALFPRPVVGRTWVADGAGLVEATLGVRASPGGGLALTGSTGAGVGGLEGPLPPGALGAAVATLVAAALVVPVWAALNAGGRPTGAPAAPAGGAMRRALVGLASVLSVIIAFQAVASGRLPAWVLAVGPLIPLVDLAAARYRAAAKAAS